MEGQPLYMKAYSTGRLSESSNSAWERLRECDLCPRRCGVDRLDEETGFCGIGSKAVIASFGPHFGEEGPISGRKGSGTIFFSGCNLSCLFCQNHDISQTISGREMGPEDLADTMLQLQGFGCHNINLVSPTHVVPQFLRALEKAVMKGLTVPIVYNTGGYDSLQTLSLLDGIIDIYMPDMKYSDPKVASSLSSAGDYPERNWAAVREMHRQVGDLELDEDGIALKGLLIRHLVLPEGLAGTSRVARFLADEISKETYMNIMSQYRPEHRAICLSGLDRRPTSAEIEQAYEKARQAGLHRFDR